MNNLQKTLARAAATLSIVVLAGGFAAQAGDAKPAAGGGPGVRVYYFHATSRCSTCRTIEAYTHEAVRTGFPEALQQGRLEWNLVNIDEPANRHFIQDYQLYTRAVVLVDGRKPSRWKNLDQVWKLVGDKPAFLAYVQGEVRSFGGD
jgi:hypothetical protein